MRQNNLLLKDVAGKRGLLITILILVALNVSYAQGHFQYSHDFKFKNGIYLTIDEFKNNSPSLPLSAIVDEDRGYLESALCMKKLEYVEDGEIYELKAKDIWGICINGDPYIKHVNNDGLKELLTRQCFYKLFSIGTISSYFIQQKEANDGFFDRTSGYYNPHNVNRGKLKIQEYALDTETGVSYNKKSETSDIIEIIKKDDLFKDQNIKRKEVSIFITNYNKRHPFNIPE